jgi:hypothetical protein
MLRQDFNRTTDDPEKTKKLLDELERTRGFLDRKQIPESEYKLAVTEIALNVNPYYVRWEIVFDLLKRQFSIEWAHWAQ